MSIRHGRTVAGLAAAAMLVALPLSSAEANGGQKAQALALGLVGGAVLGALAASSPPAYAAAPPVVYAQPPAVYAPPPVVYAPPPVVYAPQPVYVAPAPAPVYYAYPYVHHRPMVYVGGGYYRHY